MRIALLLAFVLLTAGCGSAGSSASGSDGSATAPSGGWYEQPTPSPALRAAASPISNPLANPASSPTPAPVQAVSATPAPSCYPVKGGAGSGATITDIRVGRHPGYDRVVVQFTGGLPSYQLVPKDPATFVGPASGAPVPVAGRAAVDPHITNVAGSPGLPAGTNVKVGYAVVKNVVVVGVYEGQADVAIGLDSLICPTVSTFSGLRLVIDFPTG